MTPTSSVTQQVTSCHSCFPLKGKILCTSHQASRAQFSAWICSIGPSELSLHTLLSCSNGSMSSSLLRSRLLLRLLLILLLCFLVLLALLLSGINKATRKARRTMHAPTRKGGPEMIDLYRKTNIIQISCFWHWLLHYELHHKDRRSWETYLWGLQNFCQQVHVHTWKKVKWIFCIKNPHKWLTWSSHWSKTKKHIKLLTDSRIAKQMKQMLTWCLFLTVFALGNMPVKSTRLFWILIE